MFNIGCQERQRFESGSAKWQHERHADPLAHLRREPTIGVVNSNYKPARDLCDAVEAQLVDSVTEGQLVMTICSSRRWAR